MSRPSAPTPAIRYSQVRLCSSGGGFEALPQGRVVLDLGRVRQTLEARGTDVVDARVMLIASVEGVETTISRAGRLLFKTRDPAAAERTLARLLPCLGLPVA